MSGSFPSWSIITLENSDVNTIRREYTMARKMGIELIDIRFDALNPRHTPESKARMGVFIAQIASFSKRNVIASLPPKRRGGRVSEMHLKESSRLELLMTIASQGFSWVEIEDDVPIDMIKSIFERAKKSGTKILLSSRLMSKDEWIPPSGELLQLSHGYKLTFDIQNAVDIRKMILTSSMVRSSVGDRSLIIATSDETPREIAWLSPMLGSDLVLMDPGKYPNLEIRDPIRSKTERPLEFWKRIGLFGSSSETDWSLSGRQLTQKTDICIHIGHQEGDNYRVPIHNSILKMSNVDSIVLPGIATNENIGKFFRDVRGLGLKGVLLDMPFMTSCMGDLDWIDKRSKRVGALNLVVCRNGKLNGYNSELYAIMDVLKKHIGGGGRKTLVIGCGIGGKAAAIASGAIGTDISIAGPTLKRTQEVVKEIGEIINPITYGSIGRSNNSFDVVINTLPANLSLGTSRDGLTVADMVRDLEPKMGLELTRSTLWTPFLSAVESRGGDAVPVMEVKLHTIIRDQKLLMGNSAPEEMVSGFLMGM
jgi:shikimate 5-dehydrogenase/3-dehydroquinate dehydratase